MERAASREVSQEADLAAAAGEAGDEGMMLVIWLVSAFCLILLLRPFISGCLFAASQLLTGSPAAGRIIYTLLLFPGVLLHELAHFFSANILGVSTGTIEIFPQEVAEGYRLGSVRVAKTDFVRQALIGASPLIAGTTALTLILQRQFGQLLSQNPRELLRYLSTLQFSGEDTVFLYLVFAVSNTMVLSKSDRRGIIPAAAALGVLTILLWVVAGSKLPVEGFIEYIASLVRSLALSFTAVSLINLSVLVPFALTVFLIAKLRGKRLRFSLMKRKITLEI